MIMTEGNAAPSAERSTRHTTTSQHSSHFGNLIQCRFVVTPERHTLYFAFFIRSDIS